MIRVPSPLEPITHPLLDRKQLTVWVKRDDLLHPEIMGNKWRKLKYNLEQAKKEGKKCLMTMGGAYSNHIAATAAAAQEYGFKSIGIIRGDELSEASNPTLQFASIKGMELRFISRSDFRKYRENPHLIGYSEDVYFLPEGGTNDLALAGCEEIVQEINIDFDLMVCPIGTGGTLAGIASSLSAHQKILGISALKGDFMKTHMADLLSKHRIDLSKADVNTTYHFGGYAKTAPELVDFMNWFKEKFSIQLDPIYTGKSFFAVWNMVKKNKFEKNLRIVLLHTGGLQGIEGFNRKNAHIVQ